MNTTQIQTTFGPVLGLIAGYLAAWWGIDQASALGVLMGAIGLGAAVYNGVITRKQALVDNVTAMPEKKQEMIVAVSKLDEVKDVILDKTVPGAAAIANAAPANVNAH